MSIAASQPRRTATRPPAARSAGQPAPPAHDDQDVVRFCQLLGDPTRLRIIRLLADGPANVGEICAAIGMTQTATSHHLRMMRLGEAVEARRDGKNSIYRIVPGKFAELAWFLGVLAKGGEGR